MKDIRKKRAKFLAIFSIVPIIFGLVFSSIIFYMFHDEDLNIRFTPNSFVSNYQTYQCNEGYCYTTYYKDYNDNTYECNIIADDASSSDLKVQKVRVYYEKDACYLKPIDFKSINSFAFFELPFLILPIALIISSIRTMIDNINIYKTLTYFESHTPTLFSHIKCYSKRNVSQNDEYHHKIKIELDLPGYGPKTFKKRLVSKKWLIEEVDVLIDLNDISKYYITEIPISESELESFKENKN